MIQKITLNGISTMICDTFFNTTTEFDYFTKTKSYPMF